MENQVVYCIVSVMMASVGLAGPAMAEDVLWVSDLERAAARVGDEVVVEGRFQGRVGAGLNQIRLKGMDQDRVEFRLEPDADRRFPSSLQYIRLEGLLTRSGDRLVLRVRAWHKIGTTDEDRYQDVARGLGATDAKAWYELAARTRRLADLHDESSLRRLAAAASVQGFRAEEASLRTPQVVDLLKLADRAAEFGLEADESRRMRHKALRWRFDSLVQASGTAGAWADHITAVEELLPGAKTPLTAADAKVAAPYQAKPIALYDSTVKDRDLFDRVFWLDSQAAAMTARAAAPNADLERIASDAARLAPDRPELNRQFLQQWAEREVARGLVAQPPAHVRRIANVFRNDLANPQRAQDVLRRWLEERRAKLGVRDADGRVRLAKDYRTDLKDDTAAARLLLDALQIEPNLPDAARELSALGYISTPTGWKRANEAELAAAASAKHAAASRLPENGMSVDQVRGIMGEPRPGDKLRLAYRHEGRLTIKEQWTYRGPPDIYVTFLVDSAGVSRVIAINTPSQK